MRTPLHKKSIIKKAMEIGSFTLLSRVLGIIREFFFIGYLGAGQFSDTFLSAYKIPNSLRKIFAEGALSATFIPTLVATTRNEGQSEANKLMTLGLLVFETIVLLLCALAMWHAAATIKLIAPGFSPEKVAAAVPLLRILMPFIFFISSSALLAGALQSVGHFFVPAFSPALLNLIILPGLLVCYYFSLPITVFCSIITFAGCVKLCVHLYTYFRLHLRFEWPTHKTVSKLITTLATFIPCAFSMSVSEISAFVDSRFASYLPEGSYSLLSYANRFMGIPLGVIGVALSTILLPHFSRINTYAPKRLGFYLLESSKLIFWVMIPATCIMGFFSHKLFITIFVPTGKISIPQALEAGTILSAYVSALSCIALNKIILNLYYAQRRTWLPFFVALITTSVNIYANSKLVVLFQAAGLAAATSLTAVLQTLLLLVFLHKYLTIQLYPYQFFSFAIRYLGQLVCILGPTLFIYTKIEQFLYTFSPYVQHLTLSTILFWFWVGPLCLASLAVLFYTRKRFNINLYFID